MASPTDLPVGDTGAGVRHPAADGSARRRTYVPVVAATVALAALPALVGDSRYLMGLAAIGLVYAAYGVGFNIIFGETNQLFLCVGALAGVGAYGTTIVANASALSLPVTIALSGTVAALLGGLLSWVSVRRRLGVIFIGIITLTFSLMFQNLLLGQV